MYKPQESKGFKKSFKKILKHKNFKLDNFVFVVNELVLGKKLDPRFKDHALVGEWMHYRECHLQNDILLIYKYENDVLWLILEDIGSHSELF